MNIRTIEVQGQSGQCPICQHAPIKHLPDGTGHTCIICEMLAREAARDGRVRNICTMGFEFKLSQHEREQAILADKASYPPHTVCCECWCEWIQHQGYLCPSGDSTFVPDLDSKKPFLFTK